MWQFGSLKPARLTSINTEQYKVRKFVNVFILCDVELNKFATLCTAH